MGALHWLILVPVYFFGALSLYSLIDAGARLARSDVPPERVALSAVLASIVTLLVLFLSGLVTIGQVTFVPVLALGLLSFALAGIDVMLVRALPLASDEDRGRRHASDPQVL